MRFIVILLASLIINCSATNERDNLFEGLQGRESVIIYLSEYGIDSVPKEIGKLENVKRLYITSDTVSGWVIYPPLSAIHQRTSSPPFKQLPNEITNLKNLTALGLVALDLKTLPVDFSKLQKLDSLDLSLNKLTITDELEKLKKMKTLKYLGLYGNKLDTSDIIALKKENPDLTIGSNLEEAPITPE